MHPDRERGAADPGPPQAVTTPKVRRREAIRWPPLADGTRCMSAGDMFAHGSVGAGSPATRQNRDRMPP